MRLQDELQEDPRIAKWSRIAQLLDSEMLVAFRFMSDRLGVLAHEHSDLIRIAEDCALRRQIVGYLGDGQSKELAIRMAAADVGLPYETARGRTKRGSGMTLPEPVKKN